MFLMTHVDININTQTSQILAQELTLSIYRSLTIYVYAYVCVCGSHSLQFHYLK